MPWSRSMWWGAVALVGMACTRDNPAFDEGGAGPTDGPATTQTSTTTGIGPSSGEEADVGETTAGSSVDDSSVSGSDDPPAQCVSNDDCSDGVFCNGVEECDPQLGCLPSSGNPCAKGIACDPALDMCMMLCGEDHDIDDDGLDAIECGGMDCNDDAFGYGLGDWAHCGECNSPCGVAQACSDEGMCIPARRVFVTSMGYMGNLGGLDGADEICRGHADAEELGGTFIAFLVDEGTGLETRLELSDTPYVRLDGVHVAANRDDLLNGDLLAPLNVTETRARLEGMANLENYVWTGNSDIPVVGGGFCEDWMYGDVPCGGMAPCGVAGDATTVNILWDGIDGMPYSCNLALRLYCIEQAG